MNTVNRRADTKPRVAKWFPEREFFMRSGGHVKFLKLSSRSQIMIATAVAVALIIGAAVISFVLTSQYMAKHEKVALAAKQAEIAASEKQIETYRASIDQIAADLKTRQDFLDNVAENYFDTDVADESDAVVGEDAPEKAPVKADDATETSEAAKKISASIPEAGELAVIERRQLAFVDKLTRIAETRASAAEAAIRKFGLNPKTMAAAQAGAQGGPFLPYLGEDKDRTLDPRFAKLGQSLARMDALERSLVAIPSGDPADVNRMSSNFGYRSDPITRQGAMHSGIDFKGERGQSILAAANGQVSFAGWKSGYGKTVEISHGNGMMTRYAHMSSIIVKQGQRVDKGVRLGGMGSTGRSTGTHLHFEVRLNGSAINPRPFLEANRDVLKTQAVARQRTSSSANSGPRAR